MPRAFSPWPALLTALALSAAPAAARERGEETWPGVGRFGSKIQEQLGNMGFSSAMSKLVTRSRTVYEPSVHEEIVSNFRPNPGGVDMTRLAKPPRKAYKTPLEQPRIGPDEFSNRVDSELGGITTVYDAIDRVEAALPLPTPLPDEDEVSPGAPPPARPGRPSSSASYADSLAYQPAPIPRARTRPSSSASAPATTAPRPGDYRAGLTPTPPPTPLPPPLPVPLTEPETSPEPGDLESELDALAPGGFTTAPDAPKNPSDFLAGLADILAPIPEAGPDPTQDPAGSLARLEQDYAPHNASTVHQRVRGGLDRSTFTSVADGKSTTNSFYVEHGIDVQRTLGKSKDLYLTNVARIGSIHDRDDFDVALTRQYGFEGEGTAAFRATVQSQKEGEVEPDFVEAEASLAGSREHFPDWGWDFRTRYRTKGYGEVDPFYLDSDTAGLTLGVHGSDMGYNADYRFTFDRDRYPDDASNDVDRTLQEGSLWGSAYGFDLRLDSSDQHEGIKQGTLLDTYDLYDTEVSILRRISPVFTFEQTYIFETRHVDRVSANNFDYRQKARRRKLSARIDQHFDTALTYTFSSTRNRDKNTLDSIQETFDDQDREDLELYLHYGTGRADAVLTLTWGQTDYLRNVASQAFSDYDSEAMSLSVGYTFTHSLRADLAYSQDQSTYSAPINDTDSDSLSLSATYSF